MRAYVGNEMPAEWCIEGRVCGEVAVRDGTVVALGAVTWDTYGRAWGWFSTREPLSAFLIHRRVMAMISLVREVGEPSLHAICNTHIAGAERWLRRLGFREAPEMKCALGPVWKCDF